MKLSEIKQALEQVNQVKFQLPNGEEVPAHFHVTEIGNVSKHFIDCGGTIRKEAVINFQLFTDTDYDHRLSNQKLKSIIELSASRLDLEDLEIEVEYQADTIGKYGLAFDGQYFQLTTKQTDCLAKEKCGIPEKKSGVRLSALSAAQNGSCEPGAGCC
ncbi:DUF6428 family protein [Fulvivirgaceae bacterium BMA12]|uniref:DUF6428 family protein n=1 Tax=Agaribacillus aureus TaxID=3051825 RepID=A0ABT8LAG8_9BACT|nr:DUF6428 family protein [Fulvivirgaceae bacterium BMA12]